MKLWKLGAQGMSVLLLMSACSWFGGANKPAWIDGVSSDFPAAQYLVGLGQSDNRTTAEDQAYAAVARVFKAEVSAQSKDWESYLVVEEKGQARDQRRLTLDQLTRVSTDKVLENVRILDRWYDVRKGVHYALAGIQRAQAETAFMERIAELDRTVRTDLEEARQASDRLAKLRALRRSIQNLVLRETYNADLRVIRPSGQGTPPAYRVTDVARELEQFLASNFTLAVQLTGEQAEPAQRALSEGLIKEGLYVTNRQAGPAASSSELLVRGIVRVWPVDVRDPQFTYVRWCSDVELLETESQRVLGTIAKGGKEGHLTDREATAKVVRMMQQEFSTDVAKAIAAHIYGETELPGQPGPSAGCPREGAGKKPGVIH